MKELTRTEHLSLRPGEVIANKYELVSATSPSNDLIPLGEGGSGVVFKARQQLSPKAIVYRAVKFYFQSDKFNQLKDRSSHVVSAANFDNEIINLSGFNHQNILKVIEAGFWTSPMNGLQIPFLVTDLLEGPSLKQAMLDEAFRTKVTKTPDILIELIQHLCRGVSHLHSKGFFHYDIAPKNIFLQESNPGYQLVIGDLGTGRTIPSLTQKAMEKVFVVGTAEYCPTEVQKHLNQQIPLEQLEQYQPRWDLFGVAKTCLELISLREEHEESPPSWLAALRSLMTAIVDSSSDHCETVAQLHTRVDLLNPAHHSIWQIDELSANAPRTARELLPIEPVRTSIRTRAIIRHPALVRLKRVPQIMMGSKTLYSGKHDRYEHSLGVFQSTRRYLLALLNDDKFLNFFSPQYVEFSILVALLSNITRYPFHNIITGLQSRNAEWYRELHAGNIFEELLDNFGGEPSLRLTIQKYFPLVEINKLQDILTGALTAHHEPEIRFIKALFNSSIDVRVMDYLRRDSHHVGIFQGDMIDLGDILPHIRFRDNSIVLRPTGLSVLEQIITLRYWLYSRVYWNRPNRSIIAMLRWLFVSLRTVPRFEERFRSRVLLDTEDEILRLCFDTAKDNLLPAAAEICEFLLAGRPNLFKEIVQFNRAEGDANARTLCDRYETLSPEETLDLQNRLNRMLVQSRSLPPERNHVLLDLPMLSGSMKLGEDINIEGYRSEVSAASKLSGIIEGAQRGFRDHIQRLRIFLHPNSYSEIESFLPAVTREVKEFLIHQN